MPKLEWIAQKDGKTLCAKGYPIRIRRRNGFLSFAPFRVEADGHVRAISHFTLEVAKIEAERWAAEMDEFVPAGFLPQVQA